MKHTILSVLISLTSLGFCYGQLNLEHTYEPSSYAFPRFGRVYLENSGEKYHTINTINAGQQIHQLRLYNVDHTLWKTINISSPWVFHLSETLINPDAQLEIICGHTVINESGDTLLNVDRWQEGYSYNGTVLSRLPGRPDKLITSHSTGSYIAAQVRSLPGLHLEHTYNYEAQLGSFKRILLENSGEKYYYVDQTKNQIRLHNPDHTLWKTITLPPALADESIESWIYDLHLSESTINSDDKVEVCYVYSTRKGGQSGTRLYYVGIINEDGAVLLDEQASDFWADFKISELPGRPDKLILNLLDRFQVYSLPGLRLEHTYTPAKNSLGEYSYTSYHRVLLESSGEKYYRLDGIDQLRLFNSDHSPWKTITLPTPGITFAENFDISHLSDNILNKDNQIEIIYSYTTYTNNDGSYASFQAIANEHGIIQVFSPGTRLVLSEVSGLQDKLFVYREYSHNGSFRFSKVGVYSLPLTGEALSVEGRDPARAVSIYPNPVSSGAIHVASRAARLDRLSIQTVGGQTVVNLDNYTSDTPIDISSLREGVYIITGQQDSELWFSERFVVY